METLYQSKCSSSENKSGPLIAPESLRLFDEVLGRAIRDNPNCSTLPPSALRPLITCVPDLLNIVEEVLGGNPFAAERLRQTLRSFGGAVVPTPAARAVLTRLELPDSMDGQKDAEEDSRAPRHSLRTRVDRLLDPLRLEPLAAAVVYAARDREELAVMVGGLQLALLGIDEMQVLLDLALAGGDGPVIASAFNTAVRTLQVISLPNFGGPPGDPPLEPPQPGTPGVGVPGFPEPRRPLPRFGWPLPGDDDSPRGPSDAPTPFEPPRGSLVTEFFEECFLTRIVPELHRRGIGFRDLVTGISGHYLINEVNPANACPGATITINGENFGGTTAVHFVDDGGHTVVASPLSVSDDTVTVELPEAARSGPVSLYIPITTRLCLVTSTVARAGTPGEIRVGRASVIRFGIRHGLECVRRGDDTALEWSVLPDNADVTITRRFGTTETQIATAQPATGNLDLTTTTLSPGNYEFRIDVGNPDANCEDASRTVRLGIKARSVTRFVVDGVERTQGIQVFTLADPLPVSNNNIEMIANMDTIIRVFVRTTYPESGDTARVTGALTWNGTTYMPVNSPGPFIFAARAPRRTNTNHSLNFFIPAADASGEGDLEFELFTSGSCSDQFERWSESIRWERRVPLPVTIRRIAEASGDVVSETEALTLVNTAFSRIPSPKTAITLHPGVHQIREGTTEDNYCTDGGFYQLALSIAYEHNDNEGYPPASHSTSWLGLFFRLDCDVNGMMSWPSTSTCISEPDSETIAHELLHTVGLGHTITGLEMCEDIGQPVACHRIPELGPMGELAQVPFDIANNTTVTGARDLQSYRPSPNWLCADLWVLARSLIDTRY